jgi:hypothetical protein
MSFANAGVAMATERIITEASVFIFVIVASRLFSASAL